MKEFLVGLVTIVAVVSTFIFFVKWIVAGVLFLLAASCIVSVSIKVGESVLELITELMEIRTSTNT